MMPLAKTLLEMDSGWGVPVGVLLLIAVIIQLLRNNSGGSTGSNSSGGGYKGFADYSEADWKRHNDADRKRSAMSMAYAPSTAVPQASLSVAKIRSEEALDVGEHLVRLINETAERTGFSPYHIGSLIQGKTRVSFKMEDGKLNITENQLMRIAPHMETLREYCEKVPGKLSNYGIRVQDSAGD